jgi:two-component system, NarL family, response regulator NreC
VDTYKQRIEEKLGLAHRSEYVRFALEAGLLDELV